MTFQGIFERIQTVFPQISYNQLLVDTNRVIDEFAEQSRILRSTADLSLTTAVSYALPADVGSVVEVLVLDSDGKEIDDVTYFIRDGYIHLKDTYGGDLDELPGTVDTVTLRYIDTPTALTASTGVPSIPTRFHDAIIVKLLSEYHAMYGDPNRVQLFRSIYNEQLRAAKRAGNTAQWRDSINADVDYF